MVLEALGCLHRYSYIGLYSGVNVECVLQNVTFRVDLFDSRYEKKNIEVPKCYLAVYGMQTSKVTKLMQSISLQRSSLKILP